MVGKRILGLVIAISFTAGTLAIGQEVAKPNQNRIERKGHRQDRRRRLRQHKKFRMAERLNLSETQQQQLHAIRRKQIAALDLQRQELAQLRERKRAGTFTEQDSERAKVLRQEIRSARQQSHDEINAILTAEQRLQLENMRRERKESREERRQRHRELNKQPND